MNEDAFEQLQAANPLPEDPPPPPIATLMERVDRLPPEPAEPREPQRRGPKRRATFRLSLITVGAVAVTAAAPAHVSGRLQAALAGLSERDRELLMLMAWEGLELRQAAEVLGVRPNTLAVRFHRARRRLSAALGVEDGSDHAPVRHVEVPR